ncbi:MAG: ParB/RepB/Spo0J family partition protein [Rubrivivax sp.]|nr:ParB/RepB/Spo0J family partition protein [Rubrivivax sp.]
MSKKLLAKASLIKLPPLADAARQAPSVSAAQPVRASDTASAAEARSTRPALGIGQPSAVVSGATTERSGSGVSAPAASPQPVDFAGGATPPVAARSRTAPGTMAHFLASQSTAAAEVESLRERLQQFDGALPARLLDAKRIRPSRWANRHTASFEESAFQELKAEIEASGGNVQPIKVRPLPAAALAAEPAGVSSDEPPATFELVYGHRRHRACLELGLPVLAVIEDLDDLALFEQMDRENRSRKSLSPWEQGMMYRRALDEGLFASQRKLADGLGVDVALVSKSLALARLPDTVVQAFASPLEIQFRWAQPLGEAVQKDPDGVLARAKELAARRAARSAKDTLEALLAPVPTGVLNGSTPAAAERVERFGKKGAGARLAQQADGSARLDIDAGALSAERAKALREWLKQWLAA